MKGGEKGEEATNYFLARGEAKFVATPLFREVNINRT